MRTLIALITGLTFCLGGCQKDPAIGDQICKPQNRPEFADTGQLKAPNLKGKWELEGIKELGSKNFITYKRLNQHLEKAYIGKPFLNFKADYKVAMAGPVNKCSQGPYRVFYGSEQKWIDFTGNNSKPIHFCTAVGGPLIDWEKRYGSVLANTTCYSLSGNQLTIQYYVDDSNKGKLTYEKIN